MRRRHRGSALFYEVEISGTVTSGEGMTSTGFESGTVGWAIYGDGNVEFNDGTFRGTVSGASITGSEINIGPGFYVDVDGNMWMGDPVFGNAPFSVSSAGVLTATEATIEGAITGSTIDIGTAPNNFTVDVDGNLDVGPNFSVTNTGALTATDGTFTGTLTGAITATGATVQDGVFNDITANNITATGTIATASSGKRVEIGNNGNDQISFYDGVDPTPGFIEVTAGQIEIWSTGGSPRAVFTTGGNQLIGETLITNTQALNSEEALVITQSATGVDSDAVARMRLTAINSDENFNIDWYIIARQDFGESAGKLQFDYEGTVRAEFDSIGNLVLNSSRALQVGRGDNFPGSWTAYEGMFHEDLSTGYMMMSNGTDTFIGADSNVFIRPGGNTAPDIQFLEDGTKSFVRAQGSGSQSAPHFSFQGASDTGMYRPSTTGDLRFAAGGIAFLRSTSTQTFIYKNVFVSGLSSSSTTSGEPLWHFNAGGDEMYRYTSTGRLKANQRERPRQEARSILNLRPKLFDAQRMDADGTITDLDVGPRDPKQKGQIYDVVGLIAEDVAEDFPDACIYGPDGEPANIDWNAITTSIIGLLQDMDGRLDALERSGGPP